jgi:hypothetical protein
MANEQETKIFKKCVENPKKLEEDLTKLIADYFVKQGVENVSVDIKLNEQYLVKSIDGAFTIRCGAYC